MLGLPLSNETRQRVEALFCGEDVKAATELLVFECGNNLPFCENSTPEQAERVRYAALKLSRGRVDSLREAIALAKTDWRDLLMAAGFGDDARSHLRWVPEPPHTV
jgi:hypothetical protein